MAATKSRRNSILRSTRPQGKRRAKAKPSRSSGASVHPVSYSRIIALVFFVGVLPALAFYVGTEFQMTLAAIADETPGYAVLSKTLHDQTAAELGALVPRPQTVTESDQGQVVHVKAGTDVVLSLDPSYSWTAKVTDTTLFSRERAASGSASDSIRFSAKAPGSIDLTATGKPICAQGGSCSGSAQHFKTYVVIEPAS